MKLFAALLAPLCAIVLASGSAHAQSCTVSDVPMPEKGLEEYLSHPQFTKCVDTSSKKWGGGDAAGKNGGTKAQEYCWCLFVQVGEDGDKDLTSIYGDSSKECWNKKCEEWSGWGG